MSGDDVPLNTTLLSIIADSLRTLTWFKTTDGIKNKNRPVSIYDIVHGIDESTKKSNDFEVFETPEEFDKARQRILEKIKKGG